jgi:hypothetical protein
MSLIPPAERRELRAVVRSQFKVLRTEVKQRETELIAEAERQLMERYRDDDKRMDDLNWRIRQVVDQANNDIRDFLKELSDLEDGGRFSRVYGLSYPHVNRKSEDRTQLHAALTSGIKAQVQSAVLSLDRQEADLLRQLALESLESAEAQAFLARIPTVAELVPSARLKEIEAAFDQRKAAKP